jgi:Mce-associated membrane protein
MTMVTTRSETERLQRSPRSPESSADREPYEPHERHERNERHVPRDPADVAVGSGPPDAPRAGLRGARTWRPTPRLLWTLSAVLLIAAMAVTATLGRSVWQQQRDVDNRAEALAAGRQIAVDFVTMNATTFDADTQRVLDASTGAFRKEYASTLAQLKPVVTANKTVSTVERAEASFVSGDDDSAKVIVGVVAPTSNASTPKPEKKTYRLRLDLVKVGDAWKVSTLDFVS